MILGFGRPGPTTDTQRDELPEGPAEFWDLDGVHNGVDGRIAVVHELAHKKKITVVNPRRALGAKHQEYLNDEER